MTEFTDELRTRAAEHAEIKLSAGIDTARLLVEAADEIDRLLALLEGRWKDARLMNAGPDGKGAFVMSVKTELAGYIADHLLGIMQAEGGPNFVQLEADHPEVGPLTFSIERRYGRCPAVQLAEAKAEIARLLSERGSQ